MSSFRLLLVLIVVSLTGSAVLPPLLPAAVRPDCFVILMVFLAVRASRREALVLCWFTGLARDLLSSGRLGGYALLYLVAALAIGRIRSEARSRPAVSYAPYAFAATFITGAAGSLAGGLHSGVPLGWAGWGVLATVSLATALVMAPSAWALDRLAGGLGLRRRYRFGSV